MQLGNDIRVPSLIFAEVTEVQGFISCEGEEGVFGLGFEQISSHNYPPLLSEIATSLSHSIFSLYLAPYEDYPEGTYEEQEFDEYGNYVSRSNLKPKSRSSQIVFGGVDQKHYEGCLSWHDLGQFKSLLSGDKFEGFWDFRLSKVEVGGMTLSYEQVALVDSGASYVIGPPEDVAMFAYMNNAMCFDLMDPDSPQLVDCSYDAFDAALIDCDQPFFNLEFSADDVTYVLEKEDLTHRLYTSFGEVCMLRVSGSPGIPVRVFQRRNNSQY